MFEMTTKQKLVVPDIKRFKDKLIFDPRSYVI